MWYAIILAGGSGSRMGISKNKVLLPVNGEAAIVRAVRAFAALVDGMILVARPEDEAELHELMEAAGFSVTFIHGGDTRQASVWNGLCALPSACDHVLIHDGARCLVDEDTIRHSMVSVESYGTGIASVPVVDTIKQADKANCVTASFDRSSLRAMQTPQGFDVQLLRRAHLAAQKDGFTGTDDAALVERLGISVHLSEGSRRNLKLTTPEDLVMAEALIGSSSSLPSLRVGQGYDVHQLCEGRDFILCGVKVPHERGLQGHSDADVVLHALMDAMLGAMALGDIGQHFPDTDDAYRGISSMKLLEHTVHILKAHHARVVQADLTIVAQRPKLAPLIPQMRQNVAHALGLPVERVSVKATTTERLGFEGREEGISAQAVCMVEENPAFLA